MSIEYEFGEKKIFFRTVCPTVAKTEKCKFGSHGRAPYGPGVALGGKIFSRMRRTRWYQNHGCTGHIEHVRACFMK